MNQTVLNSGQFRQLVKVNAATAVSFPDVEGLAVALNTPRRPQRWWPVAAIAFGGLLTLLWDGYLLWQIGRLVVYWLGSDA
jgi:hypothetical protein